MLNRLPEVARGVLWRREQVLYRRDHARRHFQGLCRVINLLFGALSEPLAQQLADLVRMRHASGARAEALVFERCNTRQLAYLRPVGIRVEQAEPPVPRA